MLFFIYGMYKIFSTRIFAQMKDSEPTALCVVEAFDGMGGQTESPLIIAVKRSDVSQLMGAFLK